MTETERPIIVKNAVRDHLKPIELPERKHKSLPPGFDWLAYRTLPAKEGLTEFHLSRAGATAFLPIEIKARKVSHHSKRMEQMEFPLLTRCVFVGFEPRRPKHWQEICHLPTVQGVLAATEGDGQLHPFVITEAEMHVMLGKAHEMGLTNPRRSFGLGDLVRIRNGPFASFVSRVQEIRGQNARLELQILGSTRPISVPLKMLEAA